MVSTTHDPATPYQSGVDLARQLGAPLITFDGTQHTAVFDGNQCVDSAVMHYFLDGTLPPTSLRCAPELTAHSPCGPPATLLAGHR